MRRGDLLDPCATSRGDIRHLLQSVGEESEESFGERFQMAGILADLSNMHDWREPYTGAPPSRNQHVRNARKGHRVRITNIRTSGNRPPRECVAPGADVRREDSSRPNLFRIWLQRNCRYIYNYNPLPPLSLLANVDIQGCTSKYGALSYATPYITHRGSNGTFLCAGGKYVRPLHIAHVGGKEKRAPGNLPIFRRAILARNY